MRPKSVPSRPQTGWKALADPRHRRRWLVRTTAAIAIAGLVVNVSLGAATAASIVRDAETEALIKAYLAPIFKAADIRSESRAVFLVPSQSFNAFVADGSKIFVNVGAIIKSETPGELIGVLAHEAAHIGNGDLARFKEQLRRAKTATLIASLVGLGAVAAGGAAGVGGLSQAGAGLAALGGQAAQRNLLAYRRSQEAQADSTAMGYLEKAGQSGAGMLKTLDRMASDSLFLSRNVNPYLLSHPLPRERIISLRELITRSRHFNRADPQELVRRHRMVQAKLIGFTWRPQSIARRFPRGDKSLGARYARAISAYLHGPLAPALKQIDALIRVAPNNPYYWELKGQALLERGKPAESIAPLRKAVSLAPRSGLIRILLGNALVATDKTANLDEAIKNLTIGTNAEPDVSVGYRALARAFAMKNDIAMAELATAQGYLVDGSVKDAKRHATRAQSKLKPNSPAWLRADDIVSYRVPKVR